MFSIGKPSAKELVYFMVGTIVGCAFSDFVVPIVKAML